MTENKNLADDPILRAATLAGAKAFGLLPDEIDSAHFDFARAALAAADAAAPACTVGDSGPRLSEIDPRLIDGLQSLARTYGLLGVARTASLMYGDQVAAAAPARTLPDEDDLASALLAETRARIRAARERGEQPAPARTPSDAALIDLYWHTTADDWAIPDYVMVKYGRAVLERYAAAE